MDNLSLIIKVAAIGTASVALLLALSLLIAGMFIGHQRSRHRSDAERRRIHQAWRASEDRETERRRLLRSRN